MKFNKVYEKYMGAFQFLGFNALVFGLGTVFFFWATGALYHMSGWGFWMNWLRWAVLALSAIMAVTFPGIYIYMLGKSILSTTSRRENKNARCERWVRSATRRFAKTYVEDTKRYGKSQIMELLEAVDNSVHAKVPFVRILTWIFDTLPNELQMPEISFSEQEFIIDGKEYLRYKFGSVEVTL